MNGSKLALPLATSREENVHVAIFDLDRTVTRIGTYSPFLLFAARRLNPLRLACVPLVLFAMAGYKLRLLSRKRLKETMHRLMLGNAVAQERMAAVACAFAAHTIASNIYPEARLLLDQERDSGAMVVIASAAHEFYLAPICHALGAQHVIGTRSTGLGPILRARINGENCYGKEKCRRIESFLAEHGLARETTHVRLVSDDYSDLPSLMFADEPVATNPSRKLLRSARRMNWTVVDWRR